MRLSTWLFGPRSNTPLALPVGRRRSNSRGQDSARQALWSQPHVRRLEPRRVLNASVTNLVVPASAVEGDTVYVAAEAAGEGSVQYDWTVSQGEEQVAQGSGETFQFQPATEGVYEISLLVTDDAMTTDMVTATVAVSDVAPGLFSASETGVLPGGVENTAPSNLVLQPVSMVEEGQVATLRLSFDDPDEADLHTVLINWGDGTEIQLVELSEGQRSLVIGHLYADDNPTGTPQDINQIEVTVLDSVEQSITEETSILVKNDAPEISFIVDVAPIELGDTATLRFGFADAGSFDVQTVTVDWGDGSTTTETLPVGAADATLTHQYLVPPPDGNEFYTVKITVTDDDGQSGMGTTTIDVLNLGPMNLDVQPVASINENGLATLRFSFTDSRPEEQHTAMIDWGDGESTLVVLPVGDRNLTTTHRYRDDDPSGTSQDQYTINVTVLDSGEGSITDSTTVLVRNVAPTALVTELTPAVDEGQTAFLNVRFADDGLFDVHTVTIDWGDGTTTVETLPVGTRDRTFSHQFADDNPSGTPEDVHLVTITVMDDDGGQVMGTDSIVVRNVAPTSLTTQLPDVIDEGSAAELTLSFADVGLLDEHTVTIDWGDGTTTVETLPVGARDANFSHIYDNVEFDGASQVVFPVLITVTDDDGGEATSRHSLAVRNTAPTALFTTLTDAINEGGTARLNVLFSDENPFDQHTVTIDWGDGTTTVETLPVGARDGTFLHVYHDDDPSGTSQDVYPVLVTVDDGNQSISASDTILVRNVAPTALVTELTPMVVENQTAFLNIRFADEGIFDEHTVTIDWGDGTTTVETMPVGTRDRTFSHQYLDDNPSGTTEDTYVVSVTVMDDDGGSVAGTDSIIVKNAPPAGLELELTPEMIENQTAELVVRFDDPGTLDTHTVTVDWGDGTVETLPVVPEGAREITLTHQYLDDDPSGTMQDNYLVSVTLADDDGGQTSGSASILVINDAPRNLEIVLSPAATPFVVSALSVTGGQGEIVPGNGSISGVKFEDVNGNGARDVGLVRGDAPDVVFVIDVSGSTTILFQGSPVGDLNNDGVADTILDAQIAGFGALVEQLIELGFDTTAEIGIVAFSSSAFRLDMDPTTPGTQTATTAGADNDGDGVLDVLALLQGLNSTGTTNFEAALGEAADLLRDLGTTRENGNVIFLSDGFPNSNAFADEVADLQTVAGNLRAFGVGQGASLGSLQMIDPTASIFTTTDELLAVFGGLAGGEGSSTEFSEPGIGGVQIYLDLNDNGILDPDEPTTFTLHDDPETAEDETGRYMFDGLGTGSYVVREVVPPGFMQTAPSADGAHRVTLESGESRTGLDFGNQHGAMIFEDGLARLDLQFEDDGTLDVHTVTIDWGDGTSTTETLEVGSRSGTFFHQYLDDGPSGTSQHTYVITVTVTDDDAKDTSGMRSLLVKNVAPDVIAEMPTSIEEGAAVNLVGSFSDVGTLDTHTGIIDWGDGSQTVLSAAQLASGGPISHSHVYADDGTYEVVMTIVDDDGSTGTQTFEVTVANVRPTLMVVGDQEFEVGESFEIIDLATFTDPGFNNPENPHEQPGGSQETFYYEIHWGDGTVTTGTLQSDDLDQLGSAGLPTRGSFDGSHQYLLAGQYTVTVLLADDDMLAMADGTTSSVVVSGGLENQFVVATFTITVDELFFVPPPTDRTDPEPFLFDFDQAGGLDESNRGDPDLGAPQTGAVQISVQVPDLRAVYEELAASPDRFLLLQVIEVDGTPGRTYRLDPEVLLNLREFFSKLPDNDYEVYVVQPDLPGRHNWRLVVKVTVRGSQAVDITDESDGAHDKPPGEEIRIEAAPQREPPMLEVTPGDFAPVEQSDGALHHGTGVPEMALEQVTPGDSGSSDKGRLCSRLWEELATSDRIVPPRTAAAELLPVVGLALVTPERKWSERVAQAVANANNEAWQRLRFAGRRRQAVRPRRSR